jgi:cell wall-associated NlpC family hydrolase
VAAAALAAAFVVAAPALPAQASPSAADIQAQIDALNDQIESVVEQYNGISTKLAKDQKAASKLQSTLGQNELQSAIAKDRIGNIVRAVYMAGPTSGLAILIGSGSTESMLDTMGALDEIARSQRATVDSANAVVDKYQSQSVALDKLVAAEKVQKAQLGAKKSDILGKLATLHRLQQAAINAGGPSSPSMNTSGCSKTSLCYRLPAPPCPQITSTGAGNVAAVKACSLVKTLHWYGWAQAGPSEYDCSGLTMTAWKAAGVTLDHFTGDQYKETTRITRSQLRPGDLVFYYSGNGWIVEAPHTGEPVRESPIDKGGSTIPSAYGRPHK